MLKSAFIALVIKMTGIYVASFNSAHVVQTFMREIYGIDLSPNQILTPDRNIFYRHKARSIENIYQSYFERSGGSSIAAGTGSKQTYRWSTGRLDALSFEFTNQTDLWSEDAWKQLNLWDFYSTKA